MNRKSGLSDHWYLLPLYGDIPLIMSLFKGEFWSLVNRSFKSFGAFMALFSKFAVFSMNMFAFVVRVFLRFRHGRSTMGLILTYFSATLILLFNWTARDYSWTPLYALYWPFHEILVGHEWSWWPSVTHDFASGHLFYLFYAFCALAVIHIIVSYIPAKNKEAHIKRGIPVFWFLGTLISKRVVKTRKWLIWFAFESVLICAIGVYFYMNDPVMGNFLVWAALCHFFLEAYEFFGLTRFTNV